MTKSQILFAVLAAVVSVIALFRNEIRNKLARRQLGDLTKEEAKGKKTELSITLELKEFGLFYIIRNDGPGIASQIRLHVATESGFTGDPLFPDDKDKLPIPKLMPGESRQIRARVSGDTGRNFEATLVWRNQDGTERTIKEKFYF